MGSESLEIIYIMIYILLLWIIPFIIIFVPQLFSKNVTYCCHPKLGFFHLYDSSLDKSDTIARSYFGFCLTSTRLYNNKTYLAFAIAHEYRHYIHYWIFNPVIYLLLYNSSKTFHTWAENNCDKAGITKPILCKKNR